MLLAGKSWAKHASLVQIRVAPGHGDPMHRRRSKSKSRQLRHSNGYVMKFKSDFDARVLVALQLRRDAFLRGA